VSELIQNTNSRHSYDLKLVGLSATFYNVCSMQKVNVKFTL